MSQAVSFPTAAWTSPGSYLNPQTLPLLAGTAARGLSAPSSSPAMASCCQEAWEWQEGLTSTAALGTS